jgi:hypothetical protein
MKLENKMMKMIYLTVFDIGYLEFAKNNILNFNNVLNDDESKLIMVSFDDKSFIEINNYINEYKFSNIEIIKDNLSYVNNQEHAIFNSKDFISICYKKIEVVLSILLKNDIVHFFDGDVYFFKNPKEIIFKKIIENDIVFQQDSPRVHNHPLYSNYVCCGNFTIKNNDRSIKLLNKILELSNEKQNDQEILYNYLNSRCDNIKNYKECSLDIYDPNLFQNGYDCFNGGYHLKNEKMVIHANHMIGKLTKINALKSIGAWLF